MVKSKNLLPVHRLVYWDACIWIAWLNKEQRPAGDMEGVVTTVEHVSFGLTTLVASVIIQRVEVPQEEFTKEQQSWFRKMIARPNLVEVDLEQPILREARELERFYEKEWKASRVKAKLTTWDAIHLATAWNKRVEAFYTFDDGKKGGLSLLGLDGNVAGRPLKICRPPYIQAPLIFR